MAKIGGRCVRQKWLGCFDSSGSHEASGNSRCSSVSTVDRHDRCSGMHGGRRPRSGRLPAGNQGLRGTARRARTRRPGSRHGTNSVLGRAVLALDWLEQLIESPVAGDAEDMALVRSELRDVLARTKNHEPCLRPYEG